MRLVRSSPPHASLPSEQRTSPFKSVAGRRSSHDEQAFQDARGRGGRNRSPLEWREDGRRDCRSRSTRVGRRARENHTSSANDAASLRYYSSSRCYPPRDYSRMKSGDELHDSEKVNKHRCRNSNGAKRSKLDDASDNGRRLEDRLGNGASDCKRHLSCHERLSIGDRETSHHNSAKNWSQEWKGRCGNNLELRSRREPSHARRGEYSMKPTDANYGANGDSRKISSNGAFWRCKDQAVSDALRRPGREVKLSDEFVAAELCMVSEQFQQTMNSEMATDEASAGSEADEHLHSDSRNQPEDVPHKSDGVPDFECDEEQECKVQGDPYEMLASLLLEDSLDVEHEFEMVVNPERVGSEFCGSIFEDDIDFCSHSMDFEGIDISDSKENEDTSSEGSRIRDSSSDHVEDLDTSDDSKENEHKTNQKRDSASVTRASGAANRLDGSGDKPYFKTGDGKSAPRYKAERVFVDVTNKFKVEATPTVTKVAEENDAHRLCQRLKQIEFGKNTLGYERYIELVPRSKRKRHHPSTPNPKQVCSKRSWDGQIRKWRRLLHDYDPPMEEGEEVAEDFAALKSSREPQSEESAKAPPRRHGASAKGSSSHQTRSKAGFGIQRKGLHPITMSLSEVNSESNANSDEREDPILGIYEDWTETES